MNFVLGLIEREPLSEWVGIDLEQRSNPPLKRLSYAKVALGELLSTFFVIIDLASPTSRETFSRNILWGRFMYCFKLSCYYTC